MNALPFDNLVVDASMNRILTEIVGLNARGNEVEQVRLNPDDYSYKIIFDEQMESHSVSQSMEPTKSNKKRKLEQNEGEIIASMKVKKRKNNKNMASAVIVLD